MPAQKSRFVAIVAIIVAAIISFVLVLAIVDRALVAHEHTAFPPPGELVDVGGKKMHVYAEGDGEVKVLLWSGLGTPCPALDWKPLIAELRDRYTVIVVENFGYGWSDWTDDARSSSAIVEETRAALAAAGFKPPFALIPHSISGTYALYYLSRYPDEVSAVLALEVDVPKIPEYTDMIPPSYGIGLARKLGIVRLATKLVPGLVPLPSNGSGLYTKDDYRLLRLMACRNAWNESIVLESEMEKANIEELSDALYPRRIPVKMLLSSEITDFVDGAGWGIDWVSLHRMALEDGSAGAVEVLPGGHYIHWENSGRIGDILDSMLGR